MKLTKLSLVAAFAISGLYAGGDIAPVPAPVVENATTVDGKGVLYYYTTNAYNTGDLFKDASTAASAAVTLNVSHKIMEGLTANFTAVGFTDLGDGVGLNKFEGQATGGFFNVANLTANYGDTTLVLGRQLLNTPMVGSFDWLLAPTGFQAYTVVNKSVEGLTLVASYIEKMRPVNSGDNWVDLTSVKSTDGNSDNYAVGATYSNGFDVSVWYYNVDAGDYSQVYADAGYEISGVKLAAQYVATDYNDAGLDSAAFGVKASTEISGFSLSAAYVSIADRAAGYVGRDGLYTSSWNSFASNNATDSYKISVGTEFAGVTATVSYADYDAADDITTDDISEMDVILNYKVMDNLTIDAIYSMTNYNLASTPAATDETDTAFELIATYKF